MPDKMSWTLSPSAQNKDFYFKWSLSCEWVKSICGCVSTPYVKSPLKKKKMTRLCLPSRDGIQFTLGKRLRLDWLLIISSAVSVVPWIKSKQVYLHVAHSTPLAKPLCVLGNLLWVQFKTPGLLALSVHERFVCTADHGGVPHCCQGCVLIYTCLHTHFRSHVGRAKCFV